MKRTLVNLLGGATLLSTVGCADLENPERKEYAQERERIYVEQDTVDMNNLISSSAGDYLLSRGENLTDYTLKGIQYQDDLIICREKLTEKLNDLRGIAIVDYRESSIDVPTTMRRSQCYGTVLIPKKE